MCLSVDYQGSDSAAENEIKAECCSGHITSVSPAGPVWTHTPTPLPRSVGELSADSEELVSCVALSLLFSQIPV